MTEKTSPQLEQELAAADRQPWYQLAFPPLLEQGYQLATGEQRLRRYRLFGAVGIVVFMLYGLVDKFYLADAYDRIWIWRWLILPGMGAAAIIGSYWAPLRRCYELLVVSVSTCCVLALTWFFSLSHMPTAQHYYGGVMLCLVFIMFGLRIPFRLACYSCFISMSYLGWVLLGWHFLDEAIRSLIFILVISSVLLGLLGLFQLEKEARRSYLLAQALQRDHRQLQQGFKQLQQISSIDGLTGLFNRRYFDQQLHKVWDARLHNKAGIALLFVDVDYFKKYNDSQGHQMGDDALIRVAQVIGRHAQPAHGCAARYGGEEFVLLLANCSVGQATRLAEQLRQDVEALGLPHPSSLCSQVVTISIGIAVAHASINQKPDWLVSTADAAVYQAKKHGRNRIVTMHSCQPLPN
ncbi:GGDEF domain protein [Aquitalea magnusonii]|uniref:diguanylate cyclase n=1 Tax=Aquitalea magnusonii TaxID=332411 RepID=A0A3G9GF73_9NEIS|nr:GGDEF domain-containing protein [Aquitalea magnusonii]BBF86530.1 GGDEF domain protein [Aquitalea magnusonii]